MDQHGFILLADITGYTGYLNASELDHARGTLTTLLELLVDHTRPPLVVSQLEGDAVFSYAVDDRAVSSQTFLEGIEQTYVAFRRAIDLMTLNNTCRCNACANVAGLDLKFFLHHGRFLPQPVGERVQLLGGDVNLLHRLTKNTVRERTGIGAYLLCTESAMERLGLDGSGMVRHEETVADFGPVTTWIADMGPVYAERQASERVVYPPEEVIVSVDTIVEAPPELVWEAVNQSDVRNALIGSDRYEVVDRGRDGRVAPGTRYVCYHGSMTVTQAVVEWRPFDRVVLRQTLPLPGRPVTVLIDLRFEPNGSATHVIYTAAALDGPPLTRMLARLMLRARGRSARAALEEFRRRVEERSTG